MSETPSVTVSFFGADIKFQIDEKLGLRVKPGYLTCYLTGSTKSCEDLPVEFTICYSGETIGNDSLEVGISVATQILQCQPRALEVLFRDACTSFGFSLLQFVLKHHKDYVEHGVVSHFDAIRRVKLRTMFQPEWQQGLLDNNPTRRHPRKPIVQQPKRMVSIPSRRELSNALDRLLRDTQAAEHLRHTMNG